ncbi:MAG TPA: hypothetical protein PKE07_15080 [Lacibacter sp.]|nr:hypothetical protein [Lacibacter sp.]HMO87601.1 hypothetical protein [Lacibacter sp.]
MQRLCLYVLLLAAAACRYPCTGTSGLAVHFTGYSEMEIQPFVIYRYTKGSGFQAPLDSVVVDSSRARFRSSGDSLRMGITDGGVLLQPRYDYEVFLPVPNRRYQVSELLEEPAEGVQFPGSRGPQCVNPITAARVNGLPALVSREELWLRK